MKNLKLKIIRETLRFTFLFLLTLGLSQISQANETFIKNIHIKGNTLIDPHSLEEHFNLGNGLKMNPFMMDLAASELRSVYRYHGHPDVDAYATWKEKKGVLTLIAHEEREYRHGAARAELAIYNLDWDFNMKTTQEQKEEAIQKLVKGYKKIKLNEEIVSSYLVKDQRARIEEIEALKKKAMREKIAKSVMAFKERNLAEEKELAEKIKEMRKRVQAAAMKKDLPGQAQKVFEFGEITPVERSAY